MAWAKSPQDLIDDFHAALPLGVEKRQMFGYPAAFVGGNMASSLYQDKVIVRVGSEADIRFLVGAGGTPFEPMKGRPMRGMVVVPEKVRRDPKALKAWIKRGVAHAATLPAKPKKKKKPAAKK